MLEETMPQLNNVGWQVKPTVPAMSHSLLSDWPKGFQDNTPLNPPKSQLLPRSLVTFHNLMVRPHCWKHHLLRHQTWINRAVAQLEVPPPLNSLCGAGSYFACCHRRKAMHQNPTFTAKWQSLVCPRRITTRRFGLWCYYTQSHSQTVLFSHSCVLNSYLNAKLYSSIFPGLTLLFQELSAEATQIPQQLWGSLGDQCTALHDAKDGRRLLQSVWATNCYGSLFTITVTLDSLYKQM